MAEGKTINSSNKGHWINEVQLTGRSSEEKSELNHINSAIYRYRESLKKKSGSYEMNDFNNTEIFTKESKEFDLPKVGKYYDIYNSKRFSKKIQSWKGIVLEINQDSFKAQLLDQTYGGTYEIGEFYIEDISPDDVDLLNIGAIFYWSVGSYMENGQVAKRSDIRFQRLILLDDDDINLIVSKVDDIFLNLKEKHIEEVTSRK